MAKRVSQGEPALSIDFFTSGFYTYRSQLFAPFKGIGVNVVSFHDPVIDGINFELTDKLQWTRRPGFSIFCPIALPDSEIVNNFYSSRNLNGDVTAFVDTTLRFASFTSVDLTTILNKTSPNQGYMAQVGNITYFADGAPADYSAIVANTGATAWGLAAPTIEPVASGMGFWQALTGFAIGNTILDPNGNIESVSAILTSNGGVESPTDFSTVALSGGVGSWSGTIGSGDTITQTFSAPAHSKYLFLQSFDFGIPSDATILGIVVSIPKQATGGTISDESVKLVVGGTVSGTEHASLATWNNAGLTTISYGSPVDTWGLTLAPSDLNTNGPSGFGVAIAANVTSTVHYQLVQAGAASSTFPVPTTTFTFPNPVGAHNTIIVTTCAFREFPITLQDNQFQTYTLVDTVVSGTFVNQVYIVSDTAPGVTTITMSTSNSFGNQFGCINCHEFAGILLASPVEDAAINATPSSPFNSGSVTAATTTDLIFSFIYANGAGAAAPAGYTLATNQNFFAAGNSQQLATAFLVPGSSGTFTPTWNTGSLGISVALKAASLATAIIGSGDPNAPVVTVYYKQASGLGGPGLSGQNEPIWATTVNNTVNDGGLVWTNYGPIETWFPLTAFPVPTVILDTNGNLQIISRVLTPVAAWDVGETYTAGQIVSFGGGYWISTNTSGNTGVPPNAGYTTTTTTGGTTTTVAWWSPAANPIVTGDIAPVWNTALGGTTDDGDYEWTNIGLGSALAFMGYAYVYAYRTIYGHLTTGSPFSNNTGAILGPLNGSISGFAISADEVTFQGNNNFQPGNVFTVSGLTTGIYLNGQTFVVDSAVPSASFPLTQVEVSGSDVLTITAINNLVSGQKVTFSGVGTATFLNGVTVTVLTSGLDNTKFEANFTHSSYGPTADTGNVLIEGSWTAAFTHADVTAVVDSGEAIPLIATLTGAGTGSALCNSIANVTQVSVTANIATIYASNNFQPGIWVTLDGITNALFLQGQQFQVIAVDQPVGTQNTWFQIFIQTPNYLLTNDTGTATFNAVEIYRTSDGGGTYLFDGAITNPGAGVTWTYHDFVTDVDLDILLVAPLSHQNDPPPGAPGSSIMNAGTIMVYWQGRLFMAVGNYVYFDAGPDCTNGIPEHSWPPSNRFQFAGPVLGLAQTPDGVGLLVYLADRVNAILGGPETISFYPTDAFTNFGISSTNSIFRDGTTIGQFTTQRQYFELVGGNKESIGDHIADYLAANFTPTKTYATLHRDGLDVGVFLSNGVDRVLRFGSNITAWSVPAFPSFGAGAMASVETSVGVYTLMIASPLGGMSANVGPTTPSSGTSVGTGVAPWLTPENITLGVDTDYATATFPSAGISQTLRAGGYLSLNIPANAVVQGVLVSVVGKQSEILGDFAFTIRPTNAIAGSTVHTFTLGTSNTTVTFGDSTDLWGMPWSRPYQVNPGDLIGFDITGTYTGTSTFEAFVSEVQITVYYQNPGNYLYARDIQSWGDAGAYGLNVGTPYTTSNIVIGSITLSALGAELLALQHVCGYFDAVGTLNYGGPSIPEIWILPNEVNATAGEGFVQLPESTPEPPIGQNRPSATILARRWAVDMMNSNSYSQFVHHLQVKIQFEPENAPNTIKAISFKEQQS